MINTRKFKKRLISVNLRKEYYKYLKRKKVSKYLKFKIKNDPDLKKLIKDLKYFEEEVLDVLFYGSPETTREAIVLINSYYDLEYRAVNLERKVYVLGKSNKDKAYGSKNV
jgi:hypothetical protein